MTELEPGRPGSGALADTNQPSTGYPGLAEIAELLRRDRGQCPADLRVAVLRNVTVESIEPYFCFEALRAGIHATMSFGQYDDVMGDAVGGGLERICGDGTADVVVIFTRLEGLSWKLSRNFGGLAPREIDDEVDRLRRYFADVIAGVRRQSNAPVLWVGIEPPLYPAMGVSDALAEYGQVETIHRINGALKDALRADRAGLYVDITTCMLRTGGAQFYDDRFWHLSRAPYSRVGSREIAQELVRSIRAAKGWNKKCLVLDCDNTLWGGVVGEDGISGIALSRQHPGSAYFEFQHDVASLGGRGVILALCSKNNEADVLHAFDVHPDMVLRRSSFASWRINWQDKASNLREIAAELNIGLDSMVFLDDSPFEIELVRRALPEVTAIQLPRGAPSVYRRRLAELGLFDCLARSEEDASRARYYRQNTERRKARAECSDMGEYLRSLAMEVELGLADEFVTPRVAQQTQKTNQFNLTTRRYSELEIANLASSQAADVVWLRLTDRFGDSGIVGTCIVVYDGKVSTIDTFLLSCRALGRGVERAFLAMVVRRARSRGAERIRGAYLPTSKNGQVAEFYSEAGFQKEPQESGSTAHWFSLSLRGPMPEPPEYFKAVRWVQAANLPASGSA